MAQFPGREDTEEAEYGRRQLRVREAEGSAGGLEGAEPGPQATGAALEARKVRKQILLGPLMGAWPRLCLSSA